MITPKENIIMMVLDVVRDFIGKPLEPDHVGIIYTAVGFCFRDHDYVNKGRYILDRTNPVRKQLAELLNGCEERYRERHS